ncbi:MAG: DUF1501 domain-containing protein [Planctomycetaceae bacterium]
MLTRHDHLTINRSTVSRRSFLHRMSAGALGMGALSMMDLLSLQAAELRQQGRAMILLWMAGAPSQLETFDPKPNHANGGGTKSIKTSVPGIEIASSWEQTAKIMDDIALIRSMTNKEGNHLRATYQCHTGYIPSGGVKHPGFGSNVAQQLGDPNLELPSVVSVGPTQGAGFLGVDYEPFVVQQPGSLPANVSSPVTQERLQRRLGLFNQLEDNFAIRGGQAASDNQKRLYDKAAGVVLSPQTSAFDISSEPDALKARYGSNDFGKGCLLARRLVEAGVTFVEVRMNGWDTHFDNASRCEDLSRQVDPAMATLITDLKDRGMLDRTTVVWMGEFGRTPRINGRDGRDHFPRVFNVAMAGGGIRGGQVIGSSSPDGMEIADRPVSVPDLLSTFCKSLEIDPNHENMSPLGRPIKIVDGGTPVADLFG